MSKSKGEELFASAETADQFFLALQKRMSSGDLTTAEVKAFEMVAQQHGWLVGKTPAAGESPAPPKPPVPPEEPHW